MASAFPQKQSETSLSANKKMIHLHALLHRPTWYYNALFFEDAFHFQNNIKLKMKYLFSQDLKASSKIKFKKEYQILVPDKKHCYFLLLIFYPSLKFDTLSEDDPFPHQLSFLQTNSD
jgi:hypothetical protein